MAGIDKNTMEQMLKEYIEMGREQANRTPDHYEMRRYQDMIKRLSEELNLYEDFQLWLKFTHPDIIDQYRCIKDIKEKANEPK